MSFETNRVSQIKLYIILDSFVLILPFLIGLPITLAEKRYDDLFIMLSICIPLCIVVIVQFILLRKYYLGKVFVNEEGVGYKYKNKTYKIFKWEEIIKVSIGNAYFVFYKDEKINRGKNIVEMKYSSTNKNYSKIMDTCKEICKLIDSKQKENGFQVQYTSENVRKIFEK
ncbi:MAG TPA: hypothetical protein IAC38_04795 [Candidatus Caccovivens faecavium]|nr:hypothetical protein [Candidatus Caccovivens faecavium]